MAQTFYTINSAQCLSFYPTVLDNSARQFRVASILADQEEYGSALSHLVLGAEELIKATALFMAGKGFSIRSKKGIAKLFYNHEARHTVFKKFFSVWLVLQPFVKKKDDDKKKRVGSWLFQAAMLADSMTRGLSNYQWWDDANKLKENGFYVDYQDGIIDPATISATQYKTALRHSRELDTEIRYFIGEVDKLDVRALDDMKQLLKEAEFFELMDEAIQNK